MPEKVRIGVVGTGFGGAVHIPGFQACPDAEVIAICSGRQERAEEAARKFGVPHAFCDYRQMLELKGLDAVNVVAPPHLHHPITMAALEANKHVLCEKPMAMNLKEATEMYQLAERRKLVHMICHEFRFMPARARMKELIDEGYLGRLLTVHSTTFYGPKNGGAFDSLTVARPWNWWSEKSKGGGLLGALGSHVIDALRHWFGEIAGVYGQVTPLVDSRKITGTGESRPVTSDDAFAFLFRFESEVLGTVVASSAARFAPGSPGMPTFEAYGSEGTLTLGSDSVLRGGQRGDGELRELPIPERLSLPSVEGHFLLKPFVLLAQEFVRGIKEGRPVAPSLYDGVKHQEVMDAVLLSQEEERWVSLPLETPR